jgi:saccharopine dehydrogenase-like NADP-dependent oxidoreductase
MSSSQSALVVGGDELGTAVITYLLAHPQRESTSIRLAMLWRAETLNSADPSTQSGLARLTSQGVTFEAGDVDTSPVSDLAATFGKYDVVIQCAGYGRPPSMQRRVTQAVLEAGSVRRYFP